MENIWLGLKRDNENFEWIDGSNLRFTNWLNGSPSDKSDHNCAQMLPESSPIGGWVNGPCNKRNIVVCQKYPTISLSLLHKMFLENKRELKETKETLNNTQMHLNETRKQSIEKSTKFENFLNNIFSNEWANYKLFTDNDGKRKAFILPLNENKEAKSWDDAVKVCANLNSTLVEIDSWHKHFTLQLFFGQLGSQIINMRGFWCNGKRDSSGKFKWMRSGKEITYTNWYSGYPQSGQYDFIAVELRSDSNFGKIFNTFKTEKFYVVCELDVSL